MRMTLEQFRQLAETWGGDIDRWPAASQDAARDMAAGERAGRILDEQLRLDRLFSLAPKMDEGRAGRAGFAVLQRMADVDRKPRWFRSALRPSSLLPASSLVCSALVGLWLAGALPYRHGPADALSVVSMVFDSSIIFAGGLQ
jgi:hypothetical protein